MKVRILWNSKNIKIKPPFNGEYIDFERVPNRFETFTCAYVTYEVKRVNTEIIGWKFFYTIYVDYYKG